MKAVIMAGGKGTRLAGVAGDIPKPMVSVGGKPILEHQLESLARSGVREVTMVVGHLRNRIMRYFGEEQSGIRIHYFVEESPLGTAGALVNLSAQMTEPFLLLFGDIMLDIDFCRFYAFHLEKGSKATLFAHPNSHPLDSDLLRVNTDGRVVGWEPKNRPRQKDHPNLVNAGIYVLSPEIFAGMQTGRRVDLEKEILLPLAASGGAVFAYRSTEYAKDMGTPERLRLVEQDLTAGICQARNLTNPQRCIFLDRDGTVNRLKGFLSAADQLELLDGAAEAVAAINRSKFLCCVVTNQPVVARGECSLETLDEIHARLETLLGEKGAYFDRIYFCPHHPDKGFTGEVPELKIDCSCRKPKIGMLLKAADELHIDLNASYFIGDSTVDLQTARNAGMKGFLVQTGEGGKDGRYPVHADAVFTDLKAAVDAIIKGENHDERL